MARELLLLRHAKSDRPEGVDDFNRPLKKRGKKAVLQLAEWLLEQQILPDWIVTSPALRARETAEKLCKGLNLKKSHLMHFDERIYETSIHELKNVLADCPIFAKRVLLVGHNPGLEELLTDLVGGVTADDDGKILPAAALARLVLPDDWSELNPQCGQLLGIIRPAAIDSERQEKSNPE